MSAMRNFKDSEFYPEREARGRDKKEGTKKFHEEMDAAKLKYVCEFPFPNQDNNHAHALRHRLSSCLYYLEVNRLHNLDYKRKREDTGGKGKKS